MGVVHREAHEAAVLRRHVGVAHEVAAHAEVHRAHLVVHLVALLVEEGLLGDHSAARHVEVALRVGAHHGVGVLHAVVAHYVVVAVHVAGERHAGVRLQVVGLQAELQVKLQAVGKQVVGRPAEHPGVGRPEVGRLEVGRLEVGHLEVRHLEVGLLEAGQVAARRVVADLVAHPAVAAQGVAGNLWAAHRLAVDRTEGLQEAAGQGHAPQHRVSRAQQSTCKCKHCVCCSRIAFCSSEVVFFANALSKPCDFLDWKPVHGSFPRCLACPCLQNVGRCAETSLRPSAGSAGCIGTTAIEAAMAKP